MTPPAADPGRATRVRLTVLLGLGAVSYWSLFAVYPKLLWSFGVHDYGPWFLDLFALLASNDAVTRGLNPYVPNPLDYFHRPHVYSHWWLHLRDLGLTRADVHWLGIALIATFVGAVLCRLRPREPRQLLFYVAVFCSSPVLLAVNRANNDLIVFILLTPLVPCLLSPRLLVRSAAPALIAVAAALKYYPAAAVLVLLAPTASLREVRWRIVLALALLAAAGLDVAPDLAAFGALAPHPGGLLTFGANAFFDGLGWDDWVPKLLGVAGGALAFAWFWRTRPLRGWTPAGEGRAEWLEFVLGATLLAGCFFAAQNYSYRWVFALWLAPLLWSLPRDESAPARVRRFARVTRGLLLAVLWIDAAYCMVLNRFLNVVPFSTLERWAGWMFLAEQPLVWALIVCLLAFLADFIRRNLRALAGR